ncbi:MAG: AMP-binding protein [Pseudomonadota bacterium]
MSLNCPQDSSLGFEGITAPLRDHALARPHATAIYFEDERISWAQLDRDTDSLARALDVNGGRRPVLALCLPNSPALIRLFLAGVRAGYEVQVLDIDWPASMVAALLDVLSPGLIIGTCEIESTAARTAAIDPFAPCESWQSQLGQEASTPLPTVDDETIFYAGFTSGSGGLPKGFRRTRQSWLASFALDSQECELNTNDVIAAPGALSHSLFLYALVRGLHAGAAVVVGRRFTIGQWARALESRSATVLYAVPAQLRLLMRANKRHFPRIRRVLCSGAKWRESGQGAFDQYFPNAQWCEFYGASELSFVSIAKSEENPPPSSVGRAFSGVDISIRDPGGEPIPVGRIGEVFVSSPMVFSGYTGQSPVDSRSAISVGDIGYLDTDGFLFLVGRRDRMIVCAGKNIYPEEVEAVLTQYPGILQAAVVGVDDVTRGQRLVGIVSIDGESDAKRAQIVEYCREYLPQYQVPTQYLRCVDWPRTRSLKTDYAALHTQLREKQLEPLK